MQLIIYIAELSLFYVTNTMSLLGLEWYWMIEEEEELD